MRGGPEEKEGVTYVGHEMCFWALITIRTDRMIQGGEAAGEVLKERRLVGH